MIRKLVAKGLIKEAGKSTLPGRPNLYKTTSEFLDYFGLATINDLPKIIENVDDDIRYCDENINGLLSQMYTTFRKIFLL